MEFFMIDWQWRSYEGLTKNEMYDILALRQEVFTIELRCFYNDVDYLDQKATHLLGIENNKIVAYLRFFPENIIYPGAVSFGRVVTAATVRGQGLGKKMMDEVLLYLKKNNIGLPIVISAQLYLERFYNLFGFQTLGEPYETAGIMHIKMRRPSADEQI
jgi:ElaA protein